MGEKSGDLHTSHVMEQLKKTMPETQHAGIGGPLMQSQGLKALFPFEKFLIMGFAEVLKHIPFIMKVESSIKQYLAKNKPDLVVLVDYPGLNLRVAEMASKMGFKVFYFICPQFWAWKHYRVLKLQKYCHHVACILPFEKEMLDKYNINSTYVGHPVTEEIEYKLDKKEFAEKFNLDINKKWIAFFPGSRANEVQSLLPIYIETIKRLKKLKPDYEFLISKANSVSDKLFASKAFTEAEFTVIEGYSYEMMKYSDFLTVKSGTSTIEVASIVTPFAIVYKANYLSYKLAKKIIKVKFIGLPNIIFDKPIIPELIQKDVNPDKIIETILFFMDNEKEYSQMSEDFKDLHNILGHESASKQVSGLINKILME